MKKNIKNKIIKTFLLVISLLFTIVITGCDLYKNLDRDPDTFDDLTKDFLVTLVGNDELTSNFLFENPENFGVEHYEPSLPTPSVSSVLSSLIIDGYFGQVEAYNYDKLNLDQQMTTDIIMNLVNYIKNKTPEMSYLSNNYLGSYLGYQAQLPLLLVEYHFNSSLDIENYLKFLDLVPATFKSYYEFEVTKAERGYGMPDFVIEKVVSQCENFVNSILDKSNFLFNVVNEKIDNCEFLNNGQKQLYKTANNNAIETSLKEGYLYIKDNLPSLKGKSVNDMGLAHYYDKNGNNIGQQYYEIEFKNTVGYDISCEDAIDYIDNKINTYLAELLRLNTSIKNSNDKKMMETLNDIISGNIKLMSNSPEEQLNLYKELIKNDFPELNIDPNIIVKYVDKSMQNNFSPAAYMTSPIDQNLSESIYLNPASIYLKDEAGNLTQNIDANYLYTTLAHEGLPGHLYQNVYFKSQDVNPIRKLLKNSGYVEGWATYAENYSYNFLRETYADEIIDYLITEQKLTAAIYSRLDLGIHYNGWDIDQTYSFMAKYFNINSKESIVKAFQQLVEIPTNYQQYFFTYLKLCDLYDDIKLKQGNSFNPKQFHKLILDCGPAPLKFVEKRVYNFYNN